MTLNRFFEIIRVGEIYLGNWPKQKVLNCLFLENKIIFYTQLAIKLLPVFVMLAMCLSLFHPVYFKWPMTATFVLFALGLPAQGLYWLGKRSETFLPNKILPWYLAIQEKLKRPQAKSNVLSFRPKYNDLALLLKQAFENGGDDFLQKHELI
jgi:uncharacterized membrane protein YfbV (UPF0208 family)